MGEIESLLGSVEIWSLKGYRFTLHRSVAEKAGIIRPGDIERGDVFRIATPGDLAAYLVAENEEVKRLLKSKK